MAIEIFSQDCFVSGNIFGIEEYHSTSGVAHIAGTRIPQQNFSLLSPSFSSSTVAFGQASQLD